MASGYLASTQELNALIASWVVAWVVCHHLAWLLWDCSSKRPIDVVMCRPPREKDIYIRRICRSQIYCVLAVVGSVRLLARCRKFPEDLLYDFSIDHQILFSMAAAHWIVSIWEDWRTPHFLSAGLDGKALRGIRDPSALILQAYTCHHVVAGAGFMFIAYLQQCTGIGTFGLLFELPVLLLNRREMALQANVAPVWLRSKQGVWRHWQSFYVLFIAARGIPTMVYLYSLGNWQEAIGALSTMQKVLYHGMAVFFTLLNYSFLSVLFAWTKHDLDWAKYAATHESDGSTLDRGKGVYETDCDDVSEDDDEEACDTGGEGMPVDPNAQPLVQVPLKLLEEKDGKGQNSLWIAMDGAAYDVTNIVKDHPGSEEVFRDCGGKDALQQFRQICGTARAESVMLQCMVGPILYPPMRYQIFEHNEECLKCLKLISILVVMLLLNLLALSPSFSVIFPATNGTTGSGTSAIFLLGLLLAAASGAVALVLSFFWKSSRVPLSMRDQAIALGSIVYFIGLLGVCQGVPPGSLQASPVTGLEMCALGLLLQQLLAQRQRLEKQMSWLLLEVAIAAASFLLRGLPNGPHFFIRLFGFGEQYCWTALSAVFAAQGLAMVLQHARGESAEQTAAILLRGMSFAALYGLFGAMALASVMPEASAMLSLLEAMPSRFLPGLGAIALISTALLGVLANTACTASASMAMRSVAFGMVLANTLCSGLGNYSWLTIVAFIAHLATLGQSNRQYLDDAASRGRFHVEVPSHIIGLQALWDQFRLFLTTNIWRGLAVPLQNLVSFCLPDELRVYVCEMPVFDLGEDAVLGFAAHIRRGNEHKGEAERRRTKAHRPTPEYFVCNVGQISHSDARGLQDVQKTMNNLREAWTEFQTPAGDGLISNLVAVFPQVEEGLTKEINFSAWESARAAHNWYVDSPGHRRVVNQHASGVLQTFGNMLASMEAASPFKHQERCRNCSRVVEATELGGRTPKRCGVCGGPTFRYPFF